MLAATPLGIALAQMDQTRRACGRALDRLGWGPRQTPSRVLCTQPGATLRAYGDAPATGPAVLIVPAPIKRPYIWDLRPAISAVRRMLEHGLGVFILHWTMPGTAERGFGLETYAGRLILGAIDAIERRTGPSRVFLAGHSLGGTLAAIFAALHPQRVRGLVLLEAPLKLGRDAGAFAPMVAAAGKAQRVTSLLGCVPGTFLDMVSLAAAPGTFGQDRWADWLASLRDPLAARTHALVERWTLDEFPLPPRLFEQIVDQLYREDRFVRGTLMIDGRSAAAGQVTAPILSVVEPDSDIVPPASVLGFHAAVASDDAQVLWYRGDVGVALQHVGVLVGRSAHQELWPRILRWIDAR